MSTTFEFPTASSLSEGYFKQFEKDNSEFLKTLAQFLNANEWNALISTVVNKDDCSSSMSVEETDEGCQVIFENKENIDALVDFLEYKGFAVLVFRGSLFVTIRGKVTLETLPEQACNDTIAARDDGEAKTSEEFFNLLQHDGDPKSCELEDAKKETLETSVPLVWIALQRTGVEWEQYSDKETILLTNFSRSILATIRHGPITGSDIVVCSSDLYESHREYIDDVLCDGFILSKEWRQWFDNKTISGRCVLCRTGNVITDYTV